MNRLERYLTSLWYQEQLQPADRVVLALLWLPSVLYGLVLKLRAWVYAAGLFGTHRLPRPVISIGNITVGGTGKTPVTAHIARKLIAQGLKVCVISRGYGGNLEGNVALVSDGVTIFEKPEASGDEPYLLASTVPGLCVVIGSNRYQAGLLAMDLLQPDIFLLDDGFQHLRLHRDLNILLLDARMPRGNGHILPAGPLREPWGATQRAQLQIFTRSNTATCIEAAHKLPTCYAKYNLNEFRRVDTGEVISIDFLKRQQTVAVAGIAKPESFFEGLIKIGIVPCATWALGDHQDYTPETSACIARMAEQQQATIIITTEKDAVKLAGFEYSKTTVLIAAVLELEFRHEVLMDNAIQALLNTDTRKDTHADA